MSGLIKKIFQSDDNNLEQKADNEVKDEEKKEEAETKKQPEVKSEVKTAQTSKQAKKISIVQKKDDPEIYKVLLQPLITEKATDLLQQNKYCFIVPMSTNKSEVLKKFTNLYGVKPIKINFIKKLGKRVRHGRRYGKTKTVKKAIITLHPDNKIDLYEGV